MTFPSKVVGISGERQKKTMNQYKIYFGSIMVPKAPIQESRLHAGQTKVRGSVKEGCEVPTSHLCGWHTSARQMISLTGVWSGSFRLSNLKHSTVKICWYSFWRGALWPQKQCKGSVLKDTEMWISPLSGSTAATNWGTLDHFVSEHLFQYHRESSFPSV